MADASAHAVILVHYGAPDLTRRCLEALAQRETEPHRAIVVDHNPGPGLAEALAGAHPHLTILSDPSNPGFGAGCNRGAARALADGARTLWFLNNDAVAEDGVLAALVALGRAHPEVALWGTLQVDEHRVLGADVQAFTCPAPGPLPALDLPAGCRLLGPAETLSGASLFLAREAWERLGPWPEDYFLYLEDTAWCMRAHRAGLPLVITSLRIIHRRGSTTGRKSALPVFYGVRNALRLHRELRPGAGGARLWMAFHLLQKRFFQGRWGLLAPTLRGALAGFRDQGGRDPRY